jgi:hypothetical protein
VGVGDALGDGVDDTVGGGGVVVFVGVLGRGADAEALVVGAARVGEPDTSGVGEVLNRGDRVCAGPVG